MGEVVVTQLTKDIIEKNLIDKIRFNSQNLGEGESDNSIDFR